jgi:hypothetical protein
MGHCVDFHLKEIYMCVNLVKEINSIAMSWTGTGARLMLVTVQVMKLQILMAMICIVRCQFFV